MLVVPVRSRSTLIVDNCCLQLKGVQHAFIYSIPLIDEPYQLAKWRARPSLSIMPFDLPEQLCNVSNGTPVNPTRLRIWRAPLLQLMEFNTGSCIHMQHAQDPEHAAYSLLAA